MYEELDGAGDKMSGDATVIDVDTFRGLFEHVPQDLPHLLKYQVFQILSIWIKGILQH
jgi:hypothetical protein